MNYQCYSNALVTIDQQLNVSTNDLIALINKGYACLQLGAYQQAIPPLTRVLDLETNNHAARLNLAIANLRCDKLAAAQHHYEVLQKAFPTAPQVYYGLAEIAWRKRDTNTAEAKVVSARLKELKPGSR